MTVLAMLLVLGVPAGAHPHMFSSARVKAVFEGATLSRIEVEWAFDRLTSSSLLADAGFALKARYSPAETASIKRAAFDNLGRFGYFTELRVDGKPLSFKDVAGFQVEGSEGTLRYRFSFPLAIAPRTSGETILTLAFFDPNYYVTFDAIGREDVEIQGGESIACDYSIGKLPIKVDWEGQPVPDLITFRIRKK